MALVYVYVHTQKTCNLSELKTASGVDAAACLMLFFSFGSSTSDAMNSSTKPYKTCETLVLHTCIYLAAGLMSLSLSLFERWTTARHLFRPFDRERRNDELFCFYPLPSSSFAGGSVVSPRGYPYVYDRSSGLGIASVY